MARGSRQLTGDDAETIATKLGAEITRKRRNHAVATIVVGKEKVRFGIRRATKEIGHDFIPESIHLSMGKTKKIANCTWYRPDWVAELITKKIVPRGTT